MSQRFEFERTSVEKFYISHSSMSVHLLYLKHFVEATWKTKQYVISLKFSSIHDGTVDGTR